MVCLGFEPGATGWQAQTKPQSYGGGDVLVVNGDGISVIFIVNGGGFGVLAGGGGIGVVVGGGGIGVVVGGGRDRDGVLLLVGC